MNVWNSPDGWTARWTGLLFFATLLLWIFTALMWHATRRALKDGATTVRTAQRSAEAAEAAVSKSDELLRHGQETAKRQLRAYLRVDAQDPTNTSRGGVAFEHIKSGDDFKFKIKWSLFLINSGQTPAYKVIDQIDVFIANSNDHPTISDAKLVTKIAPDQGKCVINPGQGISLMGECEGTATNAEVDAVISAKRVIYTAGIVNFLDAFGDKQWLTYCLRTRLVGDRWISGIYKTGNDAS